ncbi:PAS domain S-box protein [Haloarchaeobius sp. FL176]|uniref:hybrid sensor histidine kinase/response regulator n=1 Tax=Haloarchaeobius sp. FL176 TaxID=2967129 RepID=UPI00214925A8|nr:PAS domain S-box protein [Haloarchaeobius sp. FL176]
MTATKRVLIISNDAQLRASLAAPLQWSYPNVEVLTAAGFTGVIEHLADGDLDCIVSDMATIDASPAVLQATRERHPDIPLLVLTEYDAERGSGAAVMEVVDFLDDVGDAGSDDAFAAWVANSVVRDPTDTAPPGGSRPEDLVRDVKRALVDASSPMDIEQAVCEQLTLGGRYTFAWIGEYDKREGQVVPWVSASATDDWPVSVTFPVGRGGSEQTVIERALRTREPQVVNDIEAHRAAVPWRSAATERDCNAVVVAPLYSDDELYGVLGVYSDDADGFSEMEVSALWEIASSASHVLDTIAIRGRIDQQERVLKRYERLVETVGDGMYALDSDGHFMTVNDAMLSMTGYSREGLLGEHVSIILDDEAVERGERVIQEMIADGRMEGETQEVTVDTKDGRRYPCEVQLALLPYDDEFRGTVGVMRDITERKQREHELQRQNERLDAFASIVSHDLRNPLGVSQGYLEMAMETAPEDVRGSLEHVADGLERMEDIVGDVLAIARQGQTVTETEPMELEPLVREAWTNVETPAATLTVEGSGRFEADRSRLLRAFENLFRNAIEHGGEDVTVEVGVLYEEPEHAVDTGGFQFPEEAGTGVEHVETETQTMVGFYVADDGEGMPAKVRENAFDSDFSTSDEGLGIGLWVVREVASAHGWTTQVVESESGGARFEFSDVEAP